MDQHLDVPKGQPFIWECHDCHQGVVIPGPHTNRYGEKVNVDPKIIDPEAKVFRF
jgi:hypothetical protein